MSNRRNSIGNSEVSKNVIKELKNTGRILSSDTILNVHHYNSQQDISSNAQNHNSQIVRVRSSSNSMYEIHSHNRGKYYSGTEKL